MTIPGRAALALLGLAMLAGCSAPVAGSAASRPYRGPSIDQVRAGALTTPGRSPQVLSPDGVWAASVTAGRVCVAPVAPAARSAGHCSTARPARSLAFSPDSRWLAISSVGAGVGPGAVWVMETGTGVTKPVPSVAGVGPRASARPLPSPTTAATKRTPTSKTTPTTPTAPTSTTSADLLRSGGAYLAMVWNAPSGQLILINLLIADSGPTSRVVDFDPDTGIARIVCPLSGAGQGFSGYLAAGGNVLLAGVFRENQIPPDLIEVDLAGGTATNLGLVVPPGSEVQPLAISPDGRHAVIGARSYGSSGPPRLLDLTSHTVSSLPGLTGDFGAAAFAPDGGQLLTVSGGIGSAARLAVSAADGSGRARLLGVAPGADARTRMSWSPLGLVTISGGTVRSATAARPLGWRLSG